MSVCWLQVLEGRIDHTRVVTLVRRGGHLGVVKDYLLAVQKNNLPSVNEAANELHIAEDDYAALDASVEGYDNFDQLKLAEELEVRCVLCCLCCACGFPEHRHPAACESCGDSDGGG